MSEFEINQRVAYIPYHAKADIHHKDVEHGTVISKNEAYIFVRFDGEEMAKAVTRKRLQRI